MQAAKYLRITIHDNDFTDSLEHVGYVLQQIFEFQGKYPVKESFPVLRELIKHIWYGIHNIECNLSWNEYRETRLDYFECELEIVDYLNIPDWDNYESIYIPMFDGAEILIR